MPTNTYLNDQYTKFLDGAVDAALWSTAVISEEHINFETADQYEISEEEMDKLRGTLAYHAKDWFLENHGLLAEAVGEHIGNWESCGHDFWLTSEGHGAGFWDRGMGELGEKLTDSLSGYSDLVGFYPNEEGTHVLIDTYNVVEFEENLTV